MTNKLMQIPNEYHFCRLKLEVETFEHAIKRTNESKVPKVTKTTNKKTL